MLYMSTYTHLGSADVFQDDLDPPSCRDLTPLICQIHGTTFEITCTTDGLASGSSFLLEPYEYESYALRIGAPYGSYALDATIAAVMPS